MPNRIKLINDTRKKGFLTLIGQLLPGSVSPQQFDLEVVIQLPKVYLLPVLDIFKSHSLCLFKSLMDIVSYDIPSSNFRFVLIYVLSSYKYNLRVFLKTKVSELDPTILSVASIYYSAPWLEREVYDFFGIMFFENHDLRRLLTDYGLRGHPLRKDFPLSGFVELFFDDFTKKITYQPVKLSQEWRKISKN